MPSPLFAVQVTPTCLAFALAAVSYAVSLPAGAQSRVSYSLASAAADSVARESGELGAPPRESAGFRQVTGTRLGTSLPTGLDLNLQNGLYLGAWGSGIRWENQQSLGGVLGRSVQSPNLDLYAGFRHEVGKKIWLDVGLQSFSTGFGSTTQPAELSAGGLRMTQNEVYGAVTWGLLTAKYSRNVASLFAPSAANHSLDLSANFDLGNGYSLAPRIGRQDFSSANPLAFTDYALTLGKTFANGLSLSVTALATQAGQSLYVLPGSDFTGRIGLAAGLKYAF